MLYIRAYIPSKLVSIETLLMESFYVEISLQKQKWFLCFSYSPSKNAIKSHLEILKSYLYIHPNMKVSSF